MSTTTTTPAADAKKKQQRAKISHSEGKGVTWVIASTGKSIHFDPASVLPKDIAAKVPEHYKRAAERGCSDNSRDRYADPATDVEAEIKAWVEEFKAGHFSTGGGRSGDVVTAIAQCYNIPLEKAQSEWFKMTADGRKEVSEHPRIKAVVADLVAKRAAERAAAAKTTAGAAALPKLGA